MPVILPTIWKFISGISLSAALKISAGVTLCLFVWSWHTRGNTIDDLRGSIATEQRAHSITKSSLAAMRHEIDVQNAVIEQQRANSAQAQVELAQANAASQTAQGIIDRLRSSARDVPAGPVCAPSDAAKEIWR